MKFNSSEKPTVKVFLGVTAVLGMSSILFVGCNKNSETVSTQPLIPANQPNVQIVPKHEDTLPDDKRVIYLTFDDGPNKGTENLLKVLHKRNVKATTFLVGKHVGGSKKQMLDFEDLRKDSLIEIANHSFSHALNKYNEFYRDPAKVVIDFDTANKVLKLNDKIARTPGRNIWRLNTVNSTDIKSSTKAADGLQMAGYKLVGWDLEWKPNNKMMLKGSHQNMMKKVDSIFLNDLEKTSRHLVFLTHDQYFQDEESVNEFDHFIELLQKTNKFEFRKISDYPKIKEIPN